MALEWKERNGWFTARQDTTPYSEARVFCGLTGWTYQIRTCIGGQDVTIQPDGQYNGPALEDALKTKVEKIIATLSPDAPN